MVTKWYKSNLIVVSYDELPESIKNYIESISEVTGIPLEDILNSLPVRRYLEAYGYILKDWI